MLRRSHSSAPRVARTALVVTALALLLVSCAPETDLSPSPAPSTSNPDPTPAPTEAPVFVADGTAADNLPVFTLLTQQVWASEQRASGRAYIDAFVAAGFDRSMMQVTEDQSTIGRAAESVQFSVRWGDEQCLMGQVGPSTGEPVTAVMDQLADGRCLIGETRPIDW